MQRRTIGAFFGWVSALLLPAFPAAFLAGFLLACQSAEFQPAFPEKSTFKVHHLGTYSSKLIGENEKEQQGTIFETRLSYTLEKQGPGYRLERRLDTMVARGFHKLSMPHELEKKLSIAMDLDSSRIPVRIHGYDTLGKVLGRLDQKPEFRDQLLKASDTATYAAYARDWWRMLAFLPRGREFKMYEKLPVEEINKTLETLKLDSARYDAMRYRGTHADNKRNCLEYTLQYHRTDSLPLLVEQFFFSNIPNRKYRKYSWTPGPVQGFLQFSVDRETGLPCFHSRSEIGDITMTYAKDKKTASIQLYRYEEDIYEH